MLLVIDVQVPGDLFAEVEHLDLEPVLDQAAALILARIRARFLQQVDENNVPWKPSLASIIRAKTGRGGGTLFDRGRLFHSIQLFAPKPNERSIGTDVPYGPFHQYGTQNMVARRFLGVSVGDADLVHDFINAKVFELLGG